MYVSLEEKQKRLHKPRTWCIRCLLCCRRGGRLAVHGWWTTPAASQLGGLTQTHTHPRARARTHTHTHTRARAHARTHARTRTHAHTHGPKDRQALQHTTALWREREGGGEERKKFMLRTAESRRTDGRTSKVRRMTCSLRASPCQTLFAARVT